MANAEEFCQFARLGQISKIQKFLQTHCLDINVLNLYGESALSTATSHNQILCVEYLLANRADPKLRLSAGHSAVHIACRLANVPILNLLLTIKKEDEMDGNQFQEKEDKHIYDCLQIRDHANLTPINWAAIQESVSKRQKLFAYLDKRMPGVLDSRYNTHWFHSWAKTHPWVIEQKSIKNQLAISPVRSVPQLTNTDQIHRQYSEQGSSLPATRLTPRDIIPRTSLSDYERTAIANAGYDEIYEKNQSIPSKIAFSPQSLTLPLTPITSRIVSFKHPTPMHEHRESPAKTINIKATSEKTPYCQRLSSIIKHPFSPASTHSTYRAERAHVIPTFHYPPSPTHIDSKTHKGHDVDDMVTPISSKRPSHNLLSNIAPSTSTSSSDQSSRQSNKPFASFGFDTSLDLRNHPDVTTTHTQDDDDDDDDEQSYYETNPFDYLCNSASTLGTSSPGADTYDL